MRVYCTIFFLLYAMPHSHSQEIDSLKQVLNLHPQADTMRAIVLHKLCNACRYDYTDEALDYATQSLKLSEEINYHAGVIRSLICFGKVYQNTSQYKKSIEASMKALAYLKKHNLTYQHAGILNTLASAYRAQGEIAMAANCYMQSLEIVEKNKNYESMVSTLTNLGGLYAEQGDLETGLNYFKKAYSINDTTIQLPLHKGNIAICIANVHYEKRDLEKAVDYYRIALNTQAGTMNKIWLIGTLTNIGLCLIDMDSIQEAATHINKAFLLSQDTDNIEIKAVVLRARGILLIRQDNPAMAIPLFNEALRLSKQINFKLRVMENYRDLSTAYSLTNQYKQAFENMRAAFILNDSLKSKDLSDKIASLQKGYELAQKQAEVDRLSREATIKELELARERNSKYALAGGLAFVLLGAGFVYYSFQTKTKLTRQLQQKYNEVQQQKELIESINHDLKAQALRAQMNPHFTFNALNSIQSLIMKKDTETAGKYLLKFSDLMRTLLNNSEKRWVTLEEEVETLKLYVELESLRFNSELNYTINLTGEHSYEDHVPPMVIQPFIENALLHGLLEKPGEKNLDISFTRKDNRLFCEITDNGIGRATAARVNHWNKKAHESRGIKITEQRLKILDNLTQSDSHVEISDLYDDQQNPSGTKVTLTFPHV